MMSSSSAIALAPAHPEAAEHQPAAVDEGHPEVEAVAGQEIAGQGEHDDAEADRHECLAHPQSGDAVDQHEINRPEGSHLPRREMAEPAGDKYSARDEQQECQQHPEVEGADAGPRMIGRADRDRSRYASDIHRDPGITGVARREISDEIACEHQRAPHDQHQAGELVDSGLANATNDDFDIRQSGCGFPGIYARHELSPDVATSSAMTDTAAGSPTIPMWLMPSMILTVARFPTARSEEHTSELQSRV